MMRPSKVLDQALVSRAKNTSVFDTQTPPHVTLNAHLSNYVSETMSNGPKALPMIYGCGCLYSLESTWSKNIDVVDGTVTPDSSFCFRL